MRLILLWLIAGQLLCVANCQSTELRARQMGNQPLPPQVSRGGREWRAAVYRTLIVGKSTREDMLRTLGQPLFAGPPNLQTKTDAHREIWNNYEIGGELPGKLTVIVDQHSGIIMGIDLYPENLTREEAIRYFGKDYIVTRYDFDNCLSADAGESAPLYESPTGAVTNIEYRSRGIALGINGMGKVDQINYVSKPIGAPNSLCYESNK